MRNAPKENYFSGIKIYFRWHISKVDEYIYKLRNPLQPYRFHETVHQDKLYFKILNLYLEVYSEFTILQKLYYN